MLSNLSRSQNIKTRSVCPENFTGEKGKGGMATEGTGAGAARDLGMGWKISPSISIDGNKTAVLADIHAMGAIRHFWIVDNSNVNRSLVLRIYWDGSDTPSVEAPLCDFFACADYQEYSPLSSLAVCVNPKRAFNCYWEMPFRSECKVTLENVIDTPITVYYQLDYEEKEIADDSLYFHAQYRRTNPLPYKEVHTILDNVHGKGQYVGTYIFWGVNNNGWWGEGEIKFYLDGDSTFPTICGTGTEDYFCGSYNFDIGGEYREFNTPYTGLSKVVRGNGLYKSQQRFSMYRWHICDPVYFENDIRITIQGLGWRNGKKYLPLRDDISSVAFWYQDTVCKDFPTFPSFDELEII